MTHYSATSLEQIADDLRLDAKAFRENTVYDSEGDPIRLIANAERMERGADAISTLVRNTRLADPAMEAMVKALKWIAVNYENGHINHVDFRVEAKHRADEALLAKDNGHV